MNDTAVENETIDLNLPVEGYSEASYEEEDSSLGGVIPYAYAKKHNILVEMNDDGSALVTCSMMPKVVVLSELKRRLNCKLVLNKIEAADFDQQLRDAYDKSGSQAGQLMDDMDDGFDLTRLADGFIGS